MPNSTVKSFASKSGKSVDEVEKMWDAIKQSLLDGGMKEEDAGFYPKLVGIMKKNLKIESRKVSECILDILDLCTEMVSVQEENFYSYFIVYIPNEDKDLEGFYISTNDFTGTVASISRDDVYGPFESRSAAIEFYNDTLSVMESSVVGEARELAQSWLKMYPQKIGDSKLKERNMEDKLVERRSNRFQLVVNNADTEDDIDTSFSVWDTHYNQYAIEGASESFCRQFLDYLDYADGLGVSVPVAAVASSYRYEYPDKDQYEAKLKERNDVFTVDILGEVEKLLKADNISDAVKMLVDELPLDKKAAESVVNTYKEKGGSLKDIIIKTVEG